MKNKFAYAVLVILIAVLGLSLSKAFNEQVTAKDRAAWEYKAIPATAANQDSVADFNKLGNEGWELVAIQPAPQGEINYYVFKRVK